MAPATTTTSPSRSAIKGGWQIPVFFLGLISLAAVWYGRPFLQPSAQERFVKDLRDLRFAQEKMPPDVPRVQMLIDRLARSPVADSKGAEALFVSGSAWVALAEASPMQDEAPAWWSLAFAQLEDARKSGVDKAELPRLEYRLGKAMAQTKRDPVTAAELIGKQLNCGDDPGEGYRLIADCRLRQTPPAFAAARDALKESLSRTGPRADARLVARSRLRLAEIHQNLSEAAESRKVLDRLGADTPPDLLARAKLLLARAFVSEGDTEKAARTLDSLGEVRDIPEEMRARIAYETALVRLKVNQKPQAIGSLGVAVRGRGPEGPAAKVRLAVLQLAEPVTRGESLQTLEEVMAAVPAGTEYQNALLTPDEVRALLEEGIASLRLSNDHVAALRLVEGYGKVAVPGRKTELTSEVQEAWAQALNREAATTTDAERKSALQTQARELIERAAAGRPAVASSPTIPAGSPTTTPPSILPMNVDPPAPQVTFEQKQDKLKALMATGKSAEAIALIAEMLQSTEATGESPLSRETAATLALKQAEILYTGPDKAKARPILEKALETNGAFQPSARILLARLMLDSGEEGEFRSAVEVLEKNLDSKEMQKDKAAHEQTLWRLGYLWYQKKVWDRAAIRFRQAIQFYPDSTEARQGGYHLGMSYWFQAGTLGRSIAETEEKLKAAKLAEREKTDLTRKLEEMYQQYTGFLKQAREPFANLETYLLRQSELTAAELSLLQQTSFKAAACSFGLGEFDDCIKRYEELAKRYDGQIDELVARSQIWQCYAIYMKNKPQEAAFALAKIREAFPRIPDREFNGTTPERKRAYWEEWLKNVQDISLRD